MAVECIFSLICFKFFSSFIAGLKDLAIHFHDDQLAVVSCEHLISYLSIVGLMNFGEFFDNWA